MIYIFFYICPCPRSLFIYTPHYICWGLVPMCGSSIYDLTHSYFRNDDSGVATVFERVFFPVTAQFFFFGGLTFPLGQIFGALGEKKLYLFFPRQKHNCFSQCKISSITFSWNLFKEGTTKNLHGHWQKNTIFQKSFSKTQDFSTQKYLV